MNKYHLQFNPKHLINPSAPAWRIVERTEHELNEFFVDNVSIEVNTWTEQVPEFGGRLQWTVACAGNLVINNKTAIIVGDKHP